MSHYTISNYMMSNHMISHYIILHGMISYPNISHDITLHDIISKNIIWYNVTTLHQIVWYDNTVLLDMTWYEIPITQHRKLHNVKKYYKTLLCTTLYDATIKYQLISPNIILNIFVGPCKPHTSNIKSHILAFKIRCTRLLYCHKVLTENRRFSCRGTYVRSSFFGLFFSVIIR